VEATAGGRADSGGRDGWASGWTASVLGRGVSGTYGASTLIEGGGAIGGRVGARRGGESAARGGGGRTKSMAA
jgi:hypothetical protein